MLKDPTRNVWIKCNGIWRMGSAGAPCYCNAVLPKYYKIPRNCRDSEPADFGVPDTIAVKIDEQDVGEGCETGVFAYNGRCWYFSGEDPWLPITETPEVIIITSIPRRVCRCSDCFRCLQCGGLGGPCLGKGAYITLDAYVNASYYVRPPDGPRPPMPSGPSLDTGYGLSNGVVVYATELIQGAVDNCCCTVKGHVIVYGEDGFISNEYDETYSICLNHDGTIAGPFGAASPESIIFSDCNSFYSSQYLVDVGTESTLVRVHLVRYTMHNNPGECDCNQDCSHNNYAPPEIAGSGV